jgi:probable rRNA maturation factor
LSLVELQIVVDEDLNEAAETVLAARGRLEPLWREAAAQAAARCGLEEDAQVCLTVTDDAHIQQLNRQFRGVDRATDVLSFPLQDYVCPGGARIEPAERDPDTGALALGDIVIALEHVADQAERYGHSLLREAAFLLVHGMLHLLGYDHMTPEQEGRMFAKQEEVLACIGQTR